jgi:uncharacterized protein (UPF0333 family)
MPRTGQVTVEYNLVIAVLVVAIVVAMWWFVPPFVDAMTDLSHRAETVYCTGRLISGKR